MWVSFICHVLSSTFSSCASCPNSHGLALWKEHTIFLPERVSDCQKPLDDCIALTLSPQLHVNLHHGAEFLVS
jgi:hypothetical protein